MRCPGLACVCLTCGDEVVAAGGSAHGLDAAVVTAAVHQAARSGRVPHVQCVVPASCHQPGIVLQGTDSSKSAAVSSRSIGLHVSGMQHVTSANALQCGGWCRPCKHSITGALHCQLGCQCRCSASSWPGPHLGPGHVKDAVLVSLPLRQGPVGAIAQRRHQAAAGGVDDGQEAIVVCYCQDARVALHGGVAGQGAC